jgi:hypothetical protein
MIYLDNGPIARSHVFQQVMRYLDIDVRAHLPQGKDGRRATGWFYTGFGRSVPKHPLFGFLLCKRFMYSF